MALKVGFYGPGNMGEKILSHLIEHGDNFEIKVYHPRSERTQILIEKYQVQPIKHEDMNQLNLLFLCIKPSQIEPVCLTLAPHLGKQTVVISILAGVPLNYLQRQLNTNKVVRTMMNIVIDSNQSRLFAFGDKTLISPLENVFLISYLNSNNEIDRVTSIYGCGPAFLAEFFDYYIKQSQKHFPDQSEQWVWEMFFETLKTLEKTKSSELIDQVACKDGATEQALKVMRDGNLFDLLGQTFQFAYLRAEKLGQSLQ